ncbi:uncharacterized protein IL334_005765 [Kwoniella shivajii]|uniref:Rhodanese domain-containing protein n=1 Tax=Kwoniella shivajii TaxID=564305 RepID=A0ABZ1D419_9TREE|nr:hypothetical protein IL334_005765 [Kwoniella shivajii]
MTNSLIIAPNDSRIRDPSSIVLDASWLYDPEPATRNAYEEFLAGPRFPGARFWSLDDISEPHPGGYALMLPSPERFAKFASEHGIKKDSHVIIYDSEGIFSSPRTAWTFKVYGHEKVSIIDGGLPRALAEGVELESGAPKEFTKAVVEFEEIQSLAARLTPLANDVVLIDARPSASYIAGHIPTSLLFDFPTALSKDPSGFTYLRSPEDLKIHLTERVGSECAGKILSRQVEVVNSKSRMMGQADGAACGGGLSAAINWLQLQILGVPSRLYDESWGGYSARPETIRITGSAPL